MNQYKKGVIYTIIGGACWGISGTCGEYLCTFKGMDTRLLTDIRLLGAGLVLCLFMFWAISPECETAFENAECGIALYRIWNRRFDVYAVRISDSYSENKCGNSNSATVSIGNLCFADRLSAKEKITCFAGKYCNRFLSRRYIFSSDAWKFYFIIYI